MALHYSPLDLRRRDARFAAVLQEASLASRVDEGDARLQQKGRTIATQVWNASLSVGSVTLVTGVVIFGKVCLWQVSLLLLA